MATFKGLAVDGGRAGAANLVPVRICFEDRGRVRMGRAECVRKHTVQLRLLIAALPPGATHIPAASHRDRLHNDGVEHALWEALS